MHDLLYVLIYLSSFTLYDNTEGIKDEFSPLSPESWNKKVAYNTITDIDGNKYRTIQIGDAEWMAENLKSTRYANGDLIRNCKDQLVWQTLDCGAYCSYNNNDSLALVYGNLYNHYTIRDQRNVCPTGWRIPTMEDFNNLKAFASRYSNDTINEKHILNAVVTWENSSKGKDLIGYRALPGGHRNFDGYFYANGVAAVFWTSKELTNGTAVSYSIHEKQNHFFENALNIENGISVRCVKEK